MVELGKVILCLSLRKVTSFTVKEAYVLHISKEISSRPSKTRFIASLEMKAIS